MKATILKEKFIEGVKIVERVPQKSLTLVILQNILIKAEKNFLGLEATNLEIGVKWWALVKSDESGSILIPTHLLSSLVSFFPDKPINLEKKELSLVLECENYKTEIKGFSPADFPIIPQPLEGDRLVVDSFSFCQALSQVVNLTSPSLARPEVSGVYFSFQKDLIKIVATDSFRLGEKKLFLKSPLTKEYSLILPQSSAKEIINIFGEKEGELIIYLSPNQILFESMMTETNHPRVHFVSRLIEGEYPDYEAIIPKKYETQIIFQKSDFLNQVKAASLFSGKINEVKLKIDPKQSKISVLSQNPELGEYKSFLPAKIKGKEILVSFNHRFLIDGLLEIKTPEIIFELIDEESPTILKPLGQEDYLYVVMPIKTS